MNINLNFLRDPAWTAIGVLVAILAILISVGPNVRPSELSVIHDRTLKFGYPLLPENRIQLLIEGLPNDMSNVDVNYFRIVNTSENPIIPENIVASLSVKKGEGVKRIFLVESCSAELEQYCTSDSSESASLSSPYVPLSWSAHGEEWHSSSELINPKEEACVLLVSEKETPGEMSILKMFSWSARIKNVNLKIYSSFDSYRQANVERNADFYWQIFIVLVGAGVYWFLGLFAVLFSVTYYLAVRSGWILMANFRSVGNALLVAVFAISTSEILVDIFINQRTKEQLHPIVWPLLCAHLVLIVYLFIKVINNTKEKSA